MGALAWLDRQRDTALAVPLLTDPERWRLTLPDGRPGGALRPAAGVEQVAACMAALDALSFVSADPPAT